MESNREAFFLRISGPGDYRYEGADLGILVTRGRLMTRNVGLNARAKRWIAGIKGRFVGQPLGERPLPAAATQPSAFKIL